MGKYAATKAVRNDRKRGSNSFSSVSNYVTDLPQDRSQFQLQAFLYGADPTGIYRGYISARDYGNYWNDYLRNTGQDWSDIKYPSMMMGYGSYGSAAKSTYTFVSENIKRLYS